MSIRLSLFTPWIERTLFFSSTFRDMHAERDHLRGDTFLTLDDRLKSRHHHLNVIDLRQGLETAHIKDEAARELEVLRVCLEEVKRTRPFLIGLIGDRYGWIPPEQNIQNAARAAGFEGEVAGKSVTELELLYGLMADPGQQTRSRIYLREMDYTGMPDAVRADYDERFSKDPEASAHWEKLQDLKNRLKRDFPGRVRSYTARWDAVSGKVTGLDNLGALVLKDLGADLDAETAKYEATAPSNWQEADARALDDFVLGRLRHYVERPAVTGPAMAHATGNQNAKHWGLCLTGESGIGKSTLFASLYRELKGRESQGGLLVMAHAAGIFAGSGQIDRMLRRWVHELAGFMQIADPLEAAEQSPSRERDHDPARPVRIVGEEVGAAPLTSEKIDETFHSLLVRAAQKTRIVVLLDALNQFERSVRACCLTWLPRLWPEQARLIATAIPGAETEALTRDGRRVDIRETPAISRGEARTIAEKVFQERYHRQPNAAALAALLDKRDRTNSGDRPAHGNPLWLELSLQESNLLEGDDYARADAEFPHLPGAERMQRLLVIESERMPPTVSGVYGALLDRAGRHFGVGFTRAVMSLIALGRAGWRERDLQAVVPVMLGEPPEAAWSELAFAGLRRTLGHHLAQRGAESRWDVFHAQLREAILQRYLSQPDERRTLHGLLADHLQSLPSGDPLRARETMVHLIGFGDPERAAAWLAKLQPLQWSDPLDRDDLAGAVAGLTATLEANPDPTERKQHTYWIAKLLSAMTGPGHIRAVANVFLFDLNDALSTTGALAWSRGILLEGAREALQRLYDANPLDGAAARDLAFSHGKLAQFHHQQREQARALDHFRACAALLERLDAANNQDIRGALGHTRQMIRQLTSGDAGENSATSDVAAGDPSEQILAIARKVADGNNLDLTAMNLQHKAMLVVQILEHLTDTKLAALPDDQKQAFMTQALQIAGRL